jgi:putative transposase
MVVVSREPDDRWYVTFAVDTDAPAPQEKTGHTIGMDLGVKDFAVTSDGRELVVIDRWYPSSKTCSACGYLLAGLSLSTRHWTCPRCRTRHDRDINAAKNILAAGRAVARAIQGDACGADVRHSGSSRVQSAVKQEPRPARTGIPVLQGEE